MARKQVDTTLRDLIPLRFDDTGESASPDLEERFADLLGASAIRSRRNAAISFTGNDPERLRPSALAQLMSSQPATVNGWLLAGVAEAYRRWLSAVLALPTERSDAPHHVAVARVLLATVVSTRRGDKTLQALEKTAGRYLRKLGIDLLPPRTQGAATLKAHLLAILTRVNARTDLRDETMRAEIAQREAEELAAMVLANTILGTFVHFAPETKKGTRPEDEIQAALKRQFDQLALKTVDDASLERRAAGLARKVARILSPPQQTKDRAKSLFDYERKRRTKLVGPPSAR